MESMPTVRQGNYVLLCFRVETSFSPIKSKVDLVNSMMVQIERLLVAIQLKNYL